MSEAARSTLWIRSPLWDGLWIFAGLWAPPACTRAALAWGAITGTPATLDAPGLDIQSVALIYLPLSILHRISTTYAVLGTPLLREDIRQNPRRYLYIPLAILVGCVL